MYTISNRKKLSLFLLLLTITTLINGLCVCLASSLHKPVASFSFIQMMLPATVTFLVFLASSDNTFPFPKYVCRAIFTADILMIIWAIGEIFILSPSQSESIEMILLPLCTAIFYLALFFEPNDIKDRYGLSSSNSTKKIKQIFFYLLLFIILYTVFMFIQVLFDYLGGNHNALKSFAESYSNLLLNLPYLLFLFCIASLPYFGEEYGWRGFLQPWLQKKLGMTKGILLTGLIWGLWHLPMHLFVYHSSSLFLDMIARILYCIVSGILIGYIYLKTKNIWICVAIHFMNNNMTGILSQSTSESSLNYTLQIVVLIFAALLVYAPFIQSKVFRDKKIIDSLLLPRNISNSSQNDLKHE